VVGVEQDGVAAFDFKSRAGERAPKVVNLYQLHQPFMREVETDALRVEGRQRHRVDGLLAVPEPHVADGVHVRARVLAQLKQVDDGRDHAAVGDALQLFVRLVDGNLHLGEPGEDRHAGKDFLTQVDYLKHASSPFRVRAEYNAGDGR
jgi:hypothetical protein